MTSPTDLKPLAPEMWDETLRNVLEQLGRPPNLHATMANHPALLKAWMGFRNHMVHGISLDRRDLEVVILRTAHRAKAEYEWWHHAQIALGHGLTEGQIERIGRAIETDDWSERDRLLLRAADECADHGRILAETRDALLAHFDARQLLDLIFTIGMYTTLAFMLKTLEVPLDSNSAGFASERLAGDGGSA